jgi:hypothetical protein
MLQIVRRKIMVEQRARSKPADTRSDGPINDVAIKEMTATIETIQAFAREIAQMSGQAVVRTNQHVEKHRNAHRMEEAAAIQADFLKESMDHAVQHTRKYIDAGDLPARAGATGERGGRDGRGSQGRHCGEVGRLSEVAGGT